MHHFSNSLKHLIINRHLLELWKIPFFSKNKIPENTYVIFLISHRKPNVFPIKISISLRKSYIRSNSIIKLNNEMNWINPQKQFHIVYNFVGSFLTRVTIATIIPYFLHNVKFDIISFLPASVILSIYTLIIRKLELRGLKIKNGTMSTV